ncbi:MAG: hypothetical protein LAT68_13740 [Cyclobacteriaceae bacterium]|nr:hypothetical protein [Cyclobacteriaceae bacterium]MCH8517382.1 hypothetical protein [Cyclobacteriaceae bacterium]
MREYIAVDGIQYVLLEHNAMHEITIMREFFTEDIYPIFLVSRDEDLYSFVREVSELAWQLIDFEERPLKLIFEEPHSMLATEALDADGYVHLMKIKDQTLSSLLKKYGKSLAIVAVEGKLPGEFGMVSKPISEKLGIWLSQFQKQGRIIRLGASDSIKVIK